MAERRIGRKAFRFTTKTGGQMSLDALPSLIDWAPADRALAGLYPRPRASRGGIFCGRLANAAEPSGAYCPEGRPLGGGRAGTLSADLRLCRRDNPENLIRYRYIRTTGDFP
jgi:hypothetical protein